MQTERIQDGIIIALAIIALVLGALILERETSMVSETWERVTSTVSDVSYTPEDTNEAGDEISENVRQQIAAFPGPNATEEEINVHATLVSQYAQAADTISIANCRATPFVFAGTVGDTIQIENNGDVMVNISMGPEISYDIPAGEMRDVSDAFDRGAGIYAYTCNGQGIVGVVDFAPQR